MSEDKKTDIKSRMRGYWGGNDPLPESIMAWGARAIFHPSEPRNILEFLHDRQGHLYAEDESAEHHPKHRAFGRWIDQVASKWIRKAARYLDSSDSKSFTRCFDYAGMKAVVWMSPRASYGYMYISVSVVPADKAPFDDFPAETSTKPGRVIKRAI